MFANWPSPEVLPELVAAELVDEVDVGQAVAVHVRDRDAVAVVVVDRLVVLAGVVDDPVDERDAALRDAVGEVEVVDDADRSRRPSAAPPRGRGACPCPHRRRESSPAASDRPGPTVLPPPRTRRRERDRRYAPRGARASWKPILSGPWRLPELDVDRGGVVRQMWIERQGRDGRRVVGPAVALRLDRLHGDRRLLAGDERTDRTGERPARGPSRRTCPSSSRRRRKKAGSGACRRRSRPEPRGDRRSTPAASA